MKAISLFSSAGIGDIGLREAGFEFVAFCELELDRIELIKTNFKQAEFFPGDIWEKKDEIIRKFKNSDIKLITCTAPCQGMSKNGQGTLLKNIREGKRPKLDPRNRLIIPALQIIRELNPEFVIFENVLEMRRTYIEDSNGSIINIIDLIHRSLAEKYQGDAYDVEFANYGIPQRRQRLITVFSRNKNHISLLNAGGKLIPEESHSRDGAEGLKPWVSVADAIAHFPPLDAASVESASCPSIKFHRVPVLDPQKYFWISSTPPGRSAFDNQCVKCGFNENPVHSSIKSSKGINQSSKSTPIYCQRCGALLPRPVTIDACGTTRLMSGFTSAYKRMAADLPCPTLTRNFSYACSDSKVHPTQNRVLSIAEALEIHSLTKFKYEWARSSASGFIDANDGLIRLVIGESIPPAFMQLLGKYLVDTASSRLKPRLNRGTQTSLFGFKSEVT
jgi:DNA (cytosine-5)-methyltransferase 1